MFRAASSPPGPSMGASAKGQSCHFGRRPTTSGLPLETDIVRAGRHVSKVPKAEEALMPPREGLTPSRGQRPSDLLTLEFPVATSIRAQTFGIGHPPRQLVQIEPRRCINRSHRRCL